MIPSGLLTTIETVFGYAEFAIRGYPIAMAAIGVALAPLAGAAWFARRMTRRYWD